MVWAVCQVIWADAAPELDSDQQQKQLCLFESLVRGVERIVLLTEVIYYSETLNKTP